MSVSPKVQIPLSQCNQPQQSQQNTPGCGNSSLLIHHKSWFGNPKPLRCGNLPSDAPSSGDPQNSQFSSQLHSPADRALEHPEPGRGGDIPGNLGIPGCGSQCSRLRLDSMTLEGFSNLDNSTIFGILEFFFQFFYALLTATSQAGYVG